MFEDCDSLIEIKGFTRDQIHLKKSFILYDKKDEAVCSEKQSSLIVKKFPKEKKDITNEEIDKDGESKFKKFYNYQSTLSNEITPINSEKRS